MSGNQADNPHSYANITGSTGIRVNVFAGDTELDKALRLLRAVTARVDEAVTGLASNNPEANPDSANPPGTNPINTEVSMSKLDDIFAQSIQVSRIGRATDPKPEDKIWFTTQMQDLFVLELDLAKQQIRNMLIDLAHEHYIKDASFVKELEQL